MTTYTYLKKGRMSQRPYHLLNETETASLCGRVQYVEFMNAAFDRPQSEWIPHLFVPGAGHWGALEVAPTTPGGRRWMVPAGNEMRAVGNVDWRMAAVLCNWYHNNKSLDRSAFLTGAYDVSTFGYTGPFGDIYTDQATHNPNAQYWIPTGSELLKAFHYDPNKQNPDDSVPVLSRTTMSMRGDFSNRSALLTRMPRRSAVPTAVAAVNGIARPKVQGQETIRVARPASSAFSGEAPAIRKPRPTNAESIITSGTKPRASRSTRPCTPPLVWL